MEPIDYLGAILYAASYKNELYQLGKDHSIHECLEAISFIYRKSYIDVLEDVDLLFQSFQG
jgi:hypothetical protein